MVDFVVTKSIPLVRLQGETAHVVDELIQRACELNSVPPVYRYLTALYDSDKRAYLGAHETVGGDGVSHELQLRIRFHPIHSGLLEEPNTLNLYYHQMLNYLFNEFEVKEYSHELVSQLMGLVAMDYVKQLIEKNEAPTDEKTAELLESSALPATWKFFWWKKKVVKKDFILCVKKCFNDCYLELSAIKTAFINGVSEVLLGSRQEHFEAQIVRDGKTYEVQVIVGHLSYGTPQANEGPFLKIFQDKMPGDVFPMSQMSYLLPLDANSVEIHIRDEQPIMMLLKERNLTELCTLLDGYYRMTERFSACLCSEVQPPSIVAMRRRKIHGPIRGSTARKKLSENKTSEGCYMMRQDQLAYRVYHVDALSGDGRYETHKLIENEEGQFSEVAYLDQLVFQSLEALILAKITYGKPMHQLVPNDRDKTGLQLCRKISLADSVDETEPDAKPLDFRKFKFELPMLGSTYNQQKVLKGTYERSAVVCRVLQDDDPRMIRRFLRKASDALLWRSPNFVPIIGLGVAPRVCLAAQYMPLGSLDKYLRDCGGGMSAFDLGNAALCLAKAVWYLEENGFVHGKIRCRSAFVVEGSLRPFTVKLGEPGPPVYSHQDTPWIAPEHFPDLESVAHAQKADVYALGTTLWEIFHGGRSPLDVISGENATEFFASGKRLSVAEVPEGFHSVITGCWERNLDERSAPNEIVRSINRVLHQLDTPRDREMDTQAGDVHAVCLPAKTAESKTMQLPALRRVNQEQPARLQRRNSAASQSSIASRKGWRTNNLLKFFLRRDPEYETLSSISSIAPSQHTVDTNVADDNRLNDDSFEEVLEGDIDDALAKEDWELRRSDLKLENPIGQGFFGMVFKAVLTRPSGDKEIVAAKIMKSTVADFCEKDLEREIDIMKKLRHPNIVEIIGRNDEDGLMLIMEYVGMGALSAYLAANKRTLTVKELIKFSHDVASAMAYLERKKIIHRDLAARNILVKSESCVKLSDFGLAHLLDKDYYRIQSMSRNLPIMWYAPESILYNTFTVKSDVWSYGVALWEIFTFGCEPEVKWDDPAALGQSLLAGYRLPSPDACPPEIRQIMRHCWESDKDLRPSFASLLKRITTIIELME